MRHQSFHPLRYQPSVSEASGASDAPFRLGSLTAGRRVGPAVSGSGCAAGQLLQTPPQDPVEGAVRACLEALSRVQALIVIRLATAWPVGDLTETPGVQFD